MAFLDELGRHISDAGQAVAQQTKNFTDTTRLNSAITEKEKQIVQLFANIGQAYYMRHKNDPSAEELPLITEINALTAEITQYKEEIKQIKGVTKCPKCGADVQITASFCSTCGAPVSAETTFSEAVASEPQNLCPQCQKPVLAGNRFCTHCGVKMEHDEKQAEEER